MTVTPVLSYYLLPNSRATHHEGDGFLLYGLKGIVSYLIRLSMAMPRTLLILTWLATVTVLARTTALSLTGRRQIPR